MKNLDMADPLKNIAQKKGAVTAAAQAALDEFCGQVTTAYNGENLDLETLSASMGGIGNWCGEIEKAKSPPPAGEGGWQAEFFGLPGMGGSLTCKNGDCALLLSLNGEGQPYQGVFEEGGLVTVFQAATVGGSTALTFERDGEKKTFTLPEAVQTWSSLDAFLKTFPVRPMIAPPPAPEEPVASVQPDDTTCCSKCGRALKPGARFCGECGEPASAAEIKTCPNCGKALATTARFCGECGRPSK